MARKPLLSAGLSQPVTPPVVDTRFVQAGILKVDEKGRIDPNSKIKGKLLLNPESITDEKSSNWIMSQIPGQSNPTMSWASGGPRTVTFSAFVTKDTTLEPTSTDPLAGLIDQGINAVGSIASSFAGVALPSLTGLLKGGEPGQGEELSIENQLNYYRSLEYPTYSSGRLYASPPLVVLAFGRILGSVNTIALDVVTPEHDLWVLTNLSITVNKTLPNLTPMEATVNFTFVQYAMKSFGGEHFGEHASATSTIGTSSIVGIVSGLFK